MNRPGLLPANNRRLHLYILLTLVVAIVLIAATVWVYQRRIQRLRQKLNGDTMQPISIAYGANLYRAQNHIAFIRPTMLAASIALRTNQSAEH